MQAIMFLKKIENLSSSVFYTSDVSKILGKNAEYTRIYIHRLIKKGLVNEIEKGKYSLSDDPFEIGSNLVVPSYISFISAYHIHSLTTQIPTVVQIVYPKSKKSLEIGGMKIRFTKIESKKIFGYNRVKYRNKTINLAQVEKAIVDSLYLPENCSITESYEAIRYHSLNIDLLADYVLRMDSISAIKRLGYLLELKGIDIFASLKHKLNKRYDLLNPMMKRSEINSFKWKLNINEALD